MTLAADLCTWLRIVLAPLFAWQLAHAEASAVPLAIYGVAALSDFADGRLARFGGRVTSAGRLFDHGADALLLLPALGVLASHGRVTVLLPFAAALAFGLYIVHGWRRGGSLRAADLVPSRSGAAAGIANYAIAGAAAGALWLGREPVDHVVYAASVAGAALNLAAAFERLQIMLRP